MTPEDVIKQALDEIGEMLEEQEGYVSVPFSWLVKYCTHIDFKELLSDAERAELWKKKLYQQFGISVVG